MPFILSCLQQFYKQRFSNKIVFQVAASTFFYITFLIYSKATMDKKMKEIYFSTLATKSGF